MTTSETTDSSWVAEMTSLVTPTTLYLTLATLAALALYYYRQNMGVSWEQYGVKQAKLSPFFLFADDLKTRFTELIHEYGDTVGIKDGSNMGLVTVDLNLLRHILIKDFNNFSDRRDTLKSKSPFGKSLFFAKGTEWRRQRQILSPMFTTGKLKHISKLVAESARNLANYFEKSAKSGTLVEVKDFTSRYTCEVIAKTAFGVSANFIEQKDVEFLDYARKILMPLQGVRKAAFMILDRVPHLVNLIHKLFPNLQFLDPFSIDSDKYFRSTLAATVAERRQKRQNGLNRSYVDFLDLILKANEAAEAGTLEKVEKGDDEISDDTPLRAFTDEEILGHSVLIIFAGMETTATTLQMCLYELAVHQDIQEKVFQEIQEVVQNDTPTTEELGQLHYTEQVINETLRMYPPAPLLSRQAKETKTYEGITIPKDTFVLLPYFYILKDPKVFPHPDKFDPDRFSPAAKDKRDALAFVAFGQGPRVCLGMRLAYLELKVALVHILRKVRSVVNDKTEPKKGTPEVKFIPHSLLIPEKPIMLAFELRE